MAEVGIRDPTIKLFGKTIALPLTSPNEPSSTSVHDYSSACKFVSPEFSVPKDYSCEKPETQKETSSEEFGSKKQGEGSENQITTTTTTTTDESTSGISENPSVETEKPSPKPSKNEEQSETSNSQEDKTQKKPDKIIPCPRCNSMDTKFCYYNNYNVNQPRHFCKNCQRYWTAGGSMRNVPVGAGRRKNKTSSSSNFHHLIVPENGILPHHFLTFGSDSPLSDSLPSRDDHSSKSSITASNSSEKVGKISLQQSLMKSFMPFPPHVQSFPGVPWPAYSCNPTVCPTGFPVSYFPATPYWGCTVPVLPVPSLNNSVLGKRSRDGMMISNAQNEEIVKEKSSEKCVLISNTIRVDDPKEADKSFIRCKIGIQPEKNTSLINSGHGLFAAFQSKGTVKEENDMESFSHLQANPAAFSRALKFREIA